uniref:Uncharacterized protein n=1 Tax=Arundo donax TaxID=35708 RepID=A0A0A9GFN8_ARUDO
MAREKLNAGRFGSCSSL